MNENKENSKVKYLLIGLVALIWALIIYRLIAGLKDNDSTTVPISKAAPVPQKIKKDTFNLIASYPDPFIPRPDSIEVKEIIEEPKSLKSNVINNQPGAQINNIPVTTPPLEVQYTGFIYNPDTKKKTAMLVINGKDVSGKEKEKVEADIQVIKIEEKTVTISNHGKQIVIDMK